MGVSDTVVPRGQGAQRALGQMLSCPICSGTWVAAGLIYFLILLPGPAHIFIAILGVIGIAELLNSIVESFCWSSELNHALTGIKKKEMRGDHPHPGEDNLYP